MDKNFKKNDFICPECDNGIEFSGEAKKGLIIECKACGTESEFVSSDPPVLAPLEEEK